MIKKMLPSSINKKIIIILWNSPFSSSQILMPRMNGHLTSESEKSGARNSVASVKPSVSRKRPGSSPELDHLLPVKIRPSPPCFSTSKNKLQVIIQPGRKKFHV
jgi:hypothetical protein